jgi:hypothetical protein
MNTRLLVVLALLVACAAGQAKTGGFNWAQAFSSAQNLQNTLKKVADAVGDSMKKVVSSIDFVPLVRSSVLKTQIPPMDIPLSVPLIGKVDLNLANFTIVDFNGVGLITFPTNKQIEITISKFDSAITAKWDAKELGWPHLHDKGEFDCGMKDAKLDVIVEIEESLTPANILFGNFDASQAILVKSVVLTLDTLDMKLSGGASLLYKAINGVVDVFKPTLKKKIMAAVSTQVPIALNKMISQKLAQMFPKRQAVAAPVAK